MTKDNWEDASVLLEIYRAARELRRAEFQALALEMIRSEVAFDTANWGTGRYVAPRIDATGIFETNVDPEATSAWLEIGGLDRDRAVLPGVNNPNKPLQYRARTLYSGRHNGDLRDYLRRFGRQVLMVTSVPPSSDGQWQWFAMFRANADAVFDSMQMRLCEAYIPHFGEALKINTLLAGTGQETGLDACSMGFALVNARGQLQYAQEGFISLLRLEWEEFGCDGRLPTVLRRLVATMPFGEYSGRRLRCRFRRAGDCIRLEATSQSPIECLPPRRKAVAGLYGQGYSHKEIARQLEISPSTARNHIQTIFREFGVHTRAELRALMGGRLRKSG